MVDGSSWNQWLFPSSIYQLGKDVDWNKQTAKLSSRYNFIYIFSKLEMVSRTWITMSCIRLVEYCEGIARLLSLGIEFLLGKIEFYR
jgi:hypothetical protein